MTGWTVSGNARRLLPLCIFSLACACNNERSVNELFRFPTAVDTPVDDSGGQDLPEASKFKAVRTQVTVRLAVNDGATASTEAQQQNFLLHCASMDASGQQVSFKGPQGQTLEALPVQLTGATTVMALELQVPTSVTPGANGYDFHFTLARPGVTASKRVVRASSAELPHAINRDAVISTAGTQLDAVRGSVIPGTSAEANPVDLSIASSIAYALMQATVGELPPAQFIAVHAELTALLLQQQASIEASVNVDATHTVDDYAAALGAALQTALLQTPALQQQAAQILSTAVATSVTTANADQAFASSFSAQLGAMAQQAATTLAASNVNVVQVFGFGAAPAPVAPSPGATAEGTVFLPASVTFLDTDITAAIGGRIAVTAPPITRGITGYRFYLGDAEHTPASLTLLGTVQGPTTTGLTLTGGTPAPTNATHVWVEVLAGSKSLGFVGTALVNHNSFLAQLQALAGDGQVSLSWQDVPGFTNYNVYRATNGTVTQNSSKFTTPIASYLDREVQNGTTYTYAITTGGNNCAEGELSQQVSATPVAAAPKSVGQIQAQADAEAVFVRWQPVGYAQGYRIYRADAATPNATVLAGEVGTKTNFVDADVAYGVNYLYTVKAYNAVGEGAASASAGAQLTLAPPRINCTAWSSAGAQCSVALPANADHYRWYQAPVLPVTEDNYIADSDVQTADGFQAEQSVYEPVYYAARAVDSNGNIGPMSYPSGVIREGTYPMSRAPAVAVWGEGLNIDTAVTTGVTPFRAAPVGVAVDVYDNLFVSEPNANRISGFKHLTTKNDHAMSSFVLGQPNVFTTAAGVGPQSLSRPLGLTTDTITQMPVLLAADANNARLVAYTSTRTPVANMPIAAALGASSLSAIGRGAGGNATGDGLVGVSSAAIRTGKTLVVDTAGNRVLIYNDLPYDGVTPADLVLGQQDVTSKAANAGGLSACSLSQPTSAWTDGTRIVVYDAGNARVLIWNSMPSSNAAPADLVIGQLDMASSASNAGGSANACALAGLASGDILPPTISSDGTQLAIADTRNNRVLVWPTFPTNNYAPASVVLGQSDFNSTDASPDAGLSNLNGPTGLTWWGGHLIVADTGNARVVMY